MCCHLGDRVVNCKKEEKLKIYTLSFDYCENLLNE